VRVQGALRSYAVGLAPGDQAVLYRKEGQKYTPVAAADFAWTHNQPVIITVSVQGDSLHAEVRGAEQSTVLDWRDPVPHLNGQIGFSTWHNSHTCYESLHVFPIDGMEQ
jgi:hypothetical protein